MKKKTYCTLAILLLVIASIAYFRIRQLTHAASLEQDRALITINTQSIEPSPFYEWTFTEGSLFAQKRVYFQPDTQGVIDSIQTDSGQPLITGMRVKGPRNGKAGDRLLTIDHRQLLAKKNMLSAEKKMLNTQLQRAKQQFERVNNLKKKRLIADSEYDQYHTEYYSLLAKNDVIMAQIAQLNIAIENAIVRAPFDGIIKRINARVGDYYQPSGRADSDTQREQKALLVLIDDSSLELISHLPSWFTQSVAIGAPVFIAQHHDALALSEPSHFKTGNITQGEVYAIAPSLSLDKRTTEIKIKLNDNPLHFVEGNYVVAWIQRAHRNNVLAIPRTSVMTRESGHYVYVYDKAKHIVKEKKVIIGSQNLRQTEIISGLNIGEEVVISDINKLSHLAPVKKVGK